MALARYCLRHVKKGAIGVGSPQKSCDESRSEPASSAALSFVPFWRLEREGSRPAGSRKAFPVFQPVRTAALAWKLVLRLQQTEALGRHRDQTLSRACDLSRKAWPSRCSRLLAETTVRFGEGSCSRYGPCAVFRGFVGERLQRGGKRPLIEDRRKIVPGQQQSLEESRRGRLAATRELGEGFRQVSGAGKIRSRWTVEEGAQWQSIVGLRVRPGP